MGQLLPETTLFVILQFKCRILQIRATPAFNYAQLAPYMTGVFEPPNSACHYPMFLDLNLNAWKPNLGTSCLCGDANNDGRFSISDAVFIINYIVYAGPDPGPALPWRCKWHWVD